MCNLYFTRNTCNAYVIMKHIMKYNWLVFAIKFIGVAITYIKIRNDLVRVAHWLIKVFKRLP